VKNPIFNISKLIIKKDNHKVLDVRKLDIHRGSCYVIYGDIGSGKSTLLNVLFKKEKIDKNLVKYESKDINSIASSTYNKDVCYIPQSQSMPWLKVTVENYIEKKVNTYNNLSDPKKRISNVISKMKLKKYLPLDYRKLSDGEKRWIELAVAIASDTKVLLIDGFGQYLGEDKINILSKILYRKINYDGATVIISTHVRERLARIASVFIRLDEGKIVSVRSKGKSKNNYRGRPQKSSPKKSSPKKSPPKKTQ
tara:strand:+ start:209 stop:967 length:759 start_codon:yes stop_codon:yes gene_type:complete